MAKIAYFDCFSGASGDMIIGSLLDAGLDLEVLRKGLAGLDFHGYKLTAEKVVRSGITATNSMWLWMKKSTNTITKHPITITAD